MLEFLEKPGVVIVLLLIVLVFGYKRLPETARSLGQSMRILKAETKGLKDDDRTTGQSGAQTAAAPTLPPATLPQDQAAHATAPQPLPHEQAAPPAPQQSEQRSA